MQRFIAKPYLQFGTKTGMTLMWETSQPGQGWVEYTEALPFDQKSSMGSLGTMHEVRLEGLKPQTQYFWRARTTAPDGAELVGDVLTFPRRGLPGCPLRSKSRVTSATAASQALRMAASFRAEDSARR